MSDVYLDYGHEGALGFDREGQPGQAISVFPSRVWSTLPMKKPGGWKKAGRGARYFHPGVVRSFGMMVELPSFSRPQRAVGRSEFCIFCISGLDPVA